MDARDDWRDQLLKAERRCNLYFRLGVDHVDTFHYFMARRRYFLRQLLKKQLKEFDR